MISCEIVRKACTRMATAKRKDPLIKVKPKIEEGVILGWLKKEYNNSSHRH